MRAEFLHVLSEHTSHALFLPSEGILEEESNCQFGQHDLYVLLAGEAQVESNEGVLVGALRPGGVFGQDVAVGAIEVRSDSVRAWRDSLVLCARLPGAALQKAFKKYPEDYMQLHKAVLMFHEEKIEKIEERKTWVTEIVVPALAPTSHNFNHGAT